MHRADDDDRGEGGERDAERAAGAPADERELVLRELRDLDEATGDAIAALEMREEDDATREKIEKLRTTNGRTAAEAATSERLARKLEEKL